MSGLGDPGQREERAENEGPLNPERGDREGPFSLLAVSLAHAVLHEIMAPAFLGT